MGKKETLTSSSLFRVYVVQIESHPFITVGAIELSREPFIPLNGSGMIMERLAKTMDIGGVAKEIGSRYIQWHDQRHRAVMNWIENHMKTKRNTDKKLHHFVVFPEGGIGRHQLKELQRFVKKMQNEDIAVTIVAGTHSFEYSEHSLNEYPDDIHDVDNDPYRSNNHIDANHVLDNTKENPYNRERTLNSFVLNANLDTKQILPIIHYDGSVSLRLKHLLSPFERTNTSQFVYETAENHARSTKSESSHDERDLSAFRFTLEPTSYMFLPLVCSEALQFLKTDEASILCISSHHSRPIEFRHIIERYSTNGSPAILANDGVFGGSGVFMIHDNRGENWWFVGGNHATLPKGDAILAVDLDLECTSPQAGRANPRFPAGLSGLAAIVPFNPNEPHYFISMELKQLRQRCLNSFPQPAMESGFESGKAFDYIHICDTLESLIHSKRASSVQNVKLRRLLALSQARNLDRHSLEILCNDCLFGDPEEDA